MTTTIEVERTCAVCDATNSFPSIMSTNRMGVPDLDTRPPEMERSTITFWVQRCPDCGYCRSRIERGSKRMQEVIQSDDYLAQLDSEDLPEKANEFLCNAIIAENRGDILSSAWAAIHAAWICDDLRDLEGSRKCRDQAIEILYGHIDNIEDGELQSEMIAVQCDLLRRNSRFEEASGMARIGLQKPPSENIQLVLKYQIHLAQQHEEDSHTMDKAGEFAETES